MTFDQAARCFSDKSIDLLHLAGRQDYEAIKHDFETWLPKLTPSAVVLFHNTNVTERGFGTWRFWGDLARLYPLSLEFVHSHGLGVLQLTAGENNFHLDWLDPESSEKSMLIKYFEARGAEVVQQCGSNELQEAVLPHQQELSEPDGQLAAIKRQLAERNSQIAALDQTLFNYDAQIVGLKQKVAELTQETSESQTAINALLASTSWRITAPLRALWLSRNRLEFRQTPRTPGTPGPENTVAPVTGASDRAFDAEFYLRAYPDVAVSGIDAHQHYITRGEREGRLGTPPVPVIHGELCHLDAAKSTVLVISHEASRTGAPILALHIAHQLRKKYNVIALVLGSGELIADYRKQCDIVIGPLEEPYNPVITGGVLAKLIPEIKPTFAIVNSIESRVVLPILARLFVPTLCLIHEFASYTRPLNAVSDVVFWASEVVFSAAIVRANAQEVCQALGERHPVILRQGRTIPPRPDRSPLEYDWEARRISRLMRPSSLPENTVVVLGMGFVHIRKGVDFFIACAARVAALHPHCPFRFVWVGHGFDPEKDVAYSVYLRDQLSRAGLDGLMVFAGETMRVDVVYELADIFLLSSRLDPLPNVAIDAAYYQLPIVCFDRTTGIADLLTENGFAATCVAPYLDIEEAARRLVDLIDSPALRLEVGRGLKVLGAELFDMETYVERLDQIACDCAARQSMEQKDCILIESAEVLRVDFFLEPKSCATPMAEVIRTFVRSWASGCKRRKPFPGFHPGIYLDQHGIAGEARNPLADFIAAGRPTGPWLCPVIEPSSPVAVTTQRLRVALHIHAYYTDLVPDILRRLEGQDLDLDLLISASSQTAADDIRSLLSQFGRNVVDIRITPNRGRDIGPLVTEFGSLILSRYDLIGHLHTKKTPDLKDPEFSRLWSEFLLENLLGGQYPMAAKIISAMTADESLGLVFPDDPNLCGWTDNRTIAAELAKRLDIDELPERYFWFPIGTMFWARTQALLPLLTQPWGWDDYPEEPLPYDGTILHATERLLPLVANKMGYRIALTNVPGVSR